SVTDVDACSSLPKQFETVHETTGVFETAKELGIAFVAYGPLGHGFLTGDLKSPDDLDSTDFRRTSPKFQGDNFYQNLKIVDALKVLAAKKGVSSGQMAIVWVAAQGCIPIPGTKQVGRLEENWASRDIEFTEDEPKEMRALVDAAKPAGDRYIYSAGYLFSNTILTMFSFSLPDTHQRSKPLLGIKERSPFVPQ
ncbi:NADP-dependent oxidoreductase domain-containing protein, partial [Mycena sp. CBHHK59/15]